MNTAKKAAWLNLVAWGLVLTVVSIAITAWGQYNHWQLVHMSTYDLFPVFGLLAFSLMWTQYVISVARQLAGVESSATKTYFQVTGFAVLVAIALHPGLLSWQLMRDGLGWPPGSYLNNYIKPSLKWAGLLATVCWLVFMSYELRRWFKDKSWWHYVQMLPDFAMLGILLHSLTLGTQLKHGWLRGVWYFYGVVLVLCLGYIYYHKLKPRPAAVKTTS